MVNGTPYAVDQPVSNDVRTVNFFNGRLLSAEDLRREQDANLRLRNRLGLAVGEGVVTGLEVSLPPTGSARQPVIRVGAGVAVNRRGHALELATDSLVTLARRGGSPGTPAPGSSTCGGGDFSPCSDLGQGAPLTVSGVYLLTVAPAATATGRAPVSGLGNETAGCNTDACADGVRFRAIQLPLSGTLLADVPRLRNRVAHLMYGTADPRRTRLERDPFGTPAGPYGLLDDLRPNGPSAVGLSPAEVPLACVFWTPGVGVRFVDLWSARRRISERSASVAWPDAVGDRRTAEGEAAFLQFQDEVETLRFQVPPETVVAADRFAYLPAAGLLPLATGGRRGFDFRVFFGQQPVRGPAVMEAAHLRDLLRRSYDYPAIDPASREAVWLYEIRDNLLPAPGPPTVTPQTYLVFTSGHLPYRADARYDLAYWNHANFARVG